LLTCYTSKQILATNDALAYSELLAKISNVRTVLAADDQIAIEDGLTDDDSMLDVAYTNQSDSHCHKPLPKKVRRLQMKFQRVGILVSI